MFVDVMNTLSPDLGSSVARPGNRGCWGEPAADGAGLRLANGARFGTGTLQASGRTSVTSQHRLKSRGVKIDALVNILYTSRTIRCVCVN